MTKLGRPPCLLDVVEEHFEELDFLWEQREGVVFAPDWTLDELAALEERAEAHLDGLRVAQLHAVDLVRPALTGDETFAATAATFVLMAAGDPELEGEVIAAFEQAGSPELRDGLRIGLRHCALGDVAREKLIALAGADALETAIAASDVLAFRRIAFATPGLDGLAADSAGDRDTWLGVLGRRRALTDVELLQRACADAEPRVRMAALRGAARSGSPQLLDFCRATANAGIAASPEALVMLGVLGAASDLELLISAAGDDAYARAALVGLGALGRIEAVPTLIARLEDEALARHAADAFTRITGHEIDDLAADDAPPTDDEADDAAPLPDVRHAQAIWRQIQDRFGPEVRWQSGIGVDEWGPFVDQLPLASRRDLHLAHAATGEWEGPELESLARIQRGSS